MLYLNFLDMKKKAKFGGVARFCTVTSTMKFGTLDTYASRASVRDDPRGCPFAIFDFRAFTGAWKKKLSTLLSTSIFFKPSRPIGHLPSSSQMCGFGSLSKKNPLQSSNSTTQRWTSDTSSTTAHTSRPRRKGLLLFKSQGDRSKWELYNFIFWHTNLHNLGGCLLKLMRYSRKMYSLPTPHPKELVEDILYAIYLKNIKKYLKYPKIDHFFRARISRAAQFHRRIYHLGLNSRSLT